MWQKIDNSLQKQFEFKDFNEAFGFMCRAAMVIEQHNHHPEWSNVYNKISIKLTTHDAGNTITQKDKDLAEALDALLLS